MNILGKLYHSKTARNSVWIIGERIFSAGIIALITILAARYLGAEQYGILNYGLTLTTMFTAVMKLGIDSIIVNELLNHKSKQGELLGTSIALRIGSSLLSIFAITLLLLVMNKDNPILIMVAIIQSLVLIFQAGTVLDYWFQSKLISKYVSIAKVVATIITSLYSFYLLATGKGLVWFAFSTVLTAIIVFIVMALLYFRQGGPPLKVSRNSAKYLLSKSHHFIIANIMSVIYVQIDKLMVSNMLDDTQLGFYSAAILLSTAWFFLPAAVLTSIQPSVFSAKQLSKRLYLRKLKQMYFILFWICVAFCLLLTIIAPVLIPILFGNDYDTSISVMQIAIWHVPLAILGLARNVWIVSENKGYLVKYILLTGVVVNISANLIMIPQFGIIGAAITTLITEFFVCLVAPLLFKQTRVHTKLLLEALVYKIEGGTK